MSQKASQRQLPTFAVICHFSAFSRWLTQFHGKNETVGKNKQFPDSITEIEMQRSVNFFLRQCNLDVATHAFPGLHFSGYFVIL